MQNDGLAGHRYSCVLFDVDNTLIDTTTCVRHALMECGCPDAGEIPDAELRTSSPNSILTRRGCGRLSGAYWRRYDALAVTETRLFADETGVILASLRDRKVALGVVTSCRAVTTKALLQAHGLSDFFDGCLVTYGTYPRRKPYPDPLLHALAVLRAKPGMTLYVGDAEKDAIASRAAHVAFGLAGWAQFTEEEAGVLTPDVTLECMTDLLGYT